MIAAVGLFVVLLLVGILAVRAWLVPGASQATSCELAPVLWSVHLEEGRVVGFEGPFPPMGWRKLHDLVRSAGTTGTIRYRNAASIDFSAKISERDRQRIRSVLGDCPARPSRPEG